MLMSCHDSFCDELQKFEKRRSNRDRILISFRLLHLVRNFFLQMMKSLYAIKKLRVNRRRGNGGGSQADANPSSPAISKIDGELVLVRFLSNPRASQVVPGYKKNPLPALSLSTRGILLA